jgi:hypothetical protein
MDNKQIDLAFRIILGIVLISCVMFTAYDIGVNSVKIPGQENPYFWVDDNCFSVNSTVKVQKNLDENEELFYTVIVTSEHDKQFIECFDEKGYTAKEWKDALIMSLKDGIR